MEKTIDIKKTTKEELFDLFRMLPRSNDHYELIYAGWNGPYRIHGSVVHLDIRNEKIWIQYDGTSGGIANDLLNAGISRDQIVLAFKSPDLRRHTDFAVA